MTKTLAYALMERHAAIHPFRGLLSEGYDWVVMRCSVCDVVVIHVDVPPLPEETP